MLWRLLIYYCVGAAASAATNVFQTYPKCCNNNEVLSLPVQNSSSIECVEPEDVPFAYLSYTSQTVGNFSFFDCSEDDFCVDVDKEGHIFLTSCNGTVKQITVGINKASKCCPLNNSYDIKHHTCVNTTENNNLLISNLDYLKIGLGSCNSHLAIEDFEVSYDSVHLQDDGSIFLSSNGLKFTMDNYCVDRTSERNSYVVRVCRSLDEVCKQEADSDGNKVRCVRKCCPDGEHYINRECRRKFERGMDLTKFNFEDSDDGKGLL